MFAHVPTSERMTNLKTNEKNAQIEALQEIGGGEAAFGAIFVHNDPILK
jgi:hypothetical protein